MNPTIPFKSRLCAIGLLLLLVLLPLGVPTAQADSEVINPAVLVKDINTATRSAEPQFLSAVGNRLLFSADDGMNGTNLWATDATGTGAFRLKAIKPLSPVVMSGDVGYFAASDAEHGAELWRTDGTSAGTQLVADINPGAADSYPYAFADFNGSLFFFANQNDFPPKLWKSDGTAAGTVLVTERTTFAGMSPYLLVPHNGKLFMVLSDSGIPFQLWVSDGTDAGTIRLKTFPDSGAARTITQPQEPHPPGPLDPPYNPKLTEINGTVFFYADNGHGIELWKSDGTPTGTLPATELKPATATSSPLWLTKFQGALFFITADGLWKSGGSGASTQLVKPGTFAQIVGAGNLLFSIGTDTEHGPELWRSDGTSAGTFLVKDIHPGSTASNIGYLTALNGKILFQADDGSRRLGLWQSDGTAAGTTLLKNTTANLANAPFTVIGGRLFFLAFDDQHGIELWRSDGTAAGTMLVDDSNRQPEGSQPGQFIPAGERLFFTAQGNADGRYLWRSDGTSEGTQRIDQTSYMDSGTAFLAQSVNTDLYVVSHTQHKLWRIDSLTGAPTLLLEVSNAWITVLTAMNNRLFFVVSSTAAQQSGLWQSDGTAAGTQVVKAVQANPELFVDNNTLYFSAYTAEAGTELWKSDGTTAGTMLLKDINPGASSSEPKAFVDVNGTLFFNAADGIHGSELWKSDGTTAGTVLVKDIYPGLGNANPLVFVNVNGTLFFNADDGTHGTELWKSDGTGEGTVFVKDIYPGAFGSVMIAPTIVNNRLFFISDNSSPVSYEVWVSDGTEAGTFMLKDIHPDDQPTTLSASWLTPLKDKLLFVANDVTTNGEELWISDGTTAGTQLLKDINPGPAHGTPSALTNINGVVLFAATDGSGQRALWRSDGTAAGTQLLQAIAPQPNWQKPAFVVAGSTIFFSASNDATGQELWKISLTPNQATLKTQPLVSVATDGQGQLQIDYGNQSHSLQRQVSLTAVLEPRLTYLSSSGPVTPTLQGNTLIWQLPDLAPLAAGTIMLNVQTPSDPLGTRYTVVLTLSTTTGEAAPVQTSANIEVIRAARYYLPVIQK